MLATRNIYDRLRLNGISKANITDRDDGMTDYISTARSYNIPTLINKYS